MVDGFKVELLGSLIVLERSVGRGFKGARFEIKDVSLSVCGGLSLDPRLLFRAQFRAQFPGNLGGQLTLQPERILQGSVVTLRPKMPILQRVDQLHIDRHAIALPTHAAFKHVRNVERQTDVTQVPHRFCLRDIVKPMSG